MPTAIIEFRAFIDSNARRNYITQKIIKFYDLFIIDSILSDARTIDDTSLSVFACHFAELAIVDSTGKIATRRLLLIRANIVKTNIIFEIKGLMNVNPFVDFRKKKMRLRPNVDTIENVIKSCDSIFEFVLESEIILINGTELRDFLKHKNQILYVVFSKSSEKINMSKIVDVVKHDNSNNSDNEIIFFFCYFDFANVFNEINANDLPKRGLHDHVIETMSNRDLFFDFIYNFF